MIVNKYITANKTELIDLLYSKNINLKQVAIKLNITEQQAKKKLLKEIKMLNAANIVKKIFFKPSSLKFPLRVVSSI
jgi:hypothetical protein